MDFGVTIERGAVPWQIFQQDRNGRAAIALSGSCRRIRQSFELPLTFEEVDAGAVTVKARIALESSGESVCPWTECRVDSSATGTAAGSALPTVASRPW